MARNLSFNLKGQVFSAAPVKIERKKLYGWQEKKAFDDEGKECTQSYTDETGSLILPQGGVGSGMVDGGGNWVERSELKAVYADGTPAVLVPSSYSAVIDLNKTITHEEFLDHTISGVYGLGTDPAFCSAVGEEIWTFPYIYRDGYETTTAFLLQSDGGVFMLLGYDAGFEKLFLNQTAELDEETDDTGEDEEDEIDFSMM
jgi:hypothetical protein